MANGVKSFIGGSPLGVLVRLVLLSILVGVVLEVLGLDPLNIIRSIETPDPAYLEHGLRRDHLAVALSAAGRGDRHSDLADHPAVQGAARAIINARLRGRRQHHDNDRRAFRSRLRGHQRAGVRDRGAGDARQL